VRIVTDRETGRSRPGPGQPAPHRAGYQEPGLIDSISARVRGVLMDIAAPPARLSPLPAARAAETDSASSRADTAARKARQAQDLFHDMISGLGYWRHKKASDLPAIPPGFTLPGSRPDGTPVRWASSRDNR